MSSQPRGRRIDPLPVLSCDYREPLGYGERCACEGCLARCWANRSLRSDRTVSRHECTLCTRGWLGRESDRNCEGCRAQAELHRATGPG